MTTRLYTEFRPRNNPSADFVRAVAFYGVAAPTQAHSRSEWERYVADLNEASAVNEWRLTEA
jgi:hypothetical protein